MVPRRRPTLLAGSAASLSVFCWCGVWAAWWSVLHPRGCDDQHVIAERGGLVVACCRSRHPGVTRMPDKGVPHEGCMRCSFFILRADGGRHPSRNHRPDLVDRKDRPQVSCGVGDHPVVGPNSQPQCNNRIQGISDTAFNGN